jgi:NAD(P)-dependent dehydrogenase (short-subunit alcohol dehydrogenase family)
VTDALFELSGRVGIVTGGMGQLGAEYAAALAERGMRVAIYDLASEPKPGVADLSRGLEEGTIRAHEVDVTNRASLARAT